MNQEQNNLNQNNLNTQSNNSVSNNQPLNNMYQEVTNTFNQDVQQNINVNEQTLNQTNNTYSNNQFTQVNSNNLISNSDNKNTATENNRSNKKITLVIPSIVIVAVIITVMIVFFLNNNGNNTNKDNNTENIDNNVVNNDTSINTEVSENYIERELQGIFKVKYKLNNPTSLWDTNDDFWTMEVDTVLLPSENGKVVENYHNIDELSGIYFQVREDILRTDEFLKEEYNEWLGISELKIEELEDNEFSKHIKGETSNIYFESYCFQYEHIFEDGESWTINYSIELLLYKNNYSEDLIKAVINEYHTIIDTFQFIK